MVAKCNLALGAWEKSRADAAAVASTLLQDQKKATADESRDNGVRMEIEKTKQKQVDFKLKLFELRPNLSPEQIEKLTSPPSEP